MKTGSELFSFSDPTAPFTSLAFSPDGTQLATATAPVTALRSTITDIGDGQVTSHAEDILTRDAEPMVVQQRPFALAILLPAIVKWILVVVLGIVVVLLGREKAGRDFSSQVE